MFPINFTVWFLYSSLEFLLNMDAFTEILPKVFTCKTNHTSPPLTTNHHPKVQDW